MKFQMAWRKSGTSPIQCSYSAKEVAVLTGCSQEAIEATAESNLQSHRVTMIRGNGYTFITLREQIPLHQLPSPFEQVK